MVIRRLVFALLLPSVADAGLLHKEIDVFQLTPFVGAEVTRYGFAGIDANGLTGGDFVATGVTFGALAGFKLGPLSLGVLYQRTEEIDKPPGLDLNLNKLYAEVGFNIRASIMIAVIHFDFGWAFFEANSKTEQGFGGKFGVALDFYPLKWLSLGLGVDCDLQGFDTEKKLIGGFGGTFVFRAGLHI